MRRGTLNFVVDVFLLLVMLGMAASGLVIKYVLPPGSGGGHGGDAGSGKALWGLGRHDWGDLHFWLAVALVVLVLIHVALHWAWVCVTTRRLVSGRAEDSGDIPASARNICGIGFLVVVVAGLAVFLWTASSRVTEGGRAGGERGGYRYRGGAGGDVDREATLQQEAGEQDGEAGAGAADHGAGWGAKTLLDIETESGVPAVVIREKLSLPETVSLDERLGRLRQKYGFRMSELRDIIAEYQAKPTRPPADK